MNSEAQTKQISNTVQAKVQSRQLDSVSNQTAPRIPAPQAESKDPCRMGRKLPPSAPAGTVLGRKRKKSAPLGPSKRRAQASGGWASLPDDLIGLVLRRLLAVDGGGDVVDYIAFRGVCFGWRACTPTPCDPTLRYLRPTAWVPLSDGDAVRADDACEIAFFHTRPPARPRVLRVRLPELRRHRIVGFTDGLVILLHERTTAVRVRHPFTLVAVDLPPLAAAYRETIGVLKTDLLGMNAVVCGGSATSIAVVVWFPWEQVVLAAEPDSDWKVIHQGQYVRSMLPFRGRLYAVFSSFKVIVQLYPPRRPLLEVVAHSPDVFGDHSFCRYFLVESAGQTLLVDSLFTIHLVIQMKASSSMQWTCAAAPLADHCQIHDRMDRIRPSVRPFTLVDHLLTYCHHREWANGLMFHEYHDIPECFKELRKKLQAKDSQLRIPRVVRK